jgi:hypothetical protein
MTNPTEKVFADVPHLVRLAVAGKAEDCRKLAIRMAINARKFNPVLATEIMEHILISPTDFLRGTPVEQKNEATEEERRQVNIGELGRPIHFEIRTDQGWTIRFEGEEAANHVGAIDAACVFAGDRVAWPSALPIVERSRDEATEETLEQAEIRRQYEFIGEQAHESAQRIRESDAEQDERSASASRGRWDGEWCKRCDRRNTVAWNVSNTIWNAVVRDRWNVLCLTCFDEEAQAARIAYVFTSEPKALTWADWQQERSTGIDIGPIWGPR